MHSELDRSSRGRSLLILLIGAMVTVVGFMGVRMAWEIFDFVLSDSSRIDTPYTDSSLIYQGLWLLVAVSTLIAGLSLIISALWRKQNDLIPGPTLYFLGLGLAVIGGFLIMNGLSLKAITLIVGGIFLIYWEWAYHVS